MDSSEDLRPKRVDYSLVNERDHAKEVLSDKLGDTAVQQATELVVPIVAPPLYNWEEDAGYLDATKQKPKQNPAEPTALIPLAPGQDPSLTLTAAHDPESGQLRPNS